MKLYCVRTFLYACIEPEPEYIHHMESYDIDDDICEFDMIRIVFSRDTREILSIHKCTYPYHILPASYQVITMVNQSLSNNIKYSLQDMDRPCKSLYVPDSQLIS